MNQTNRRRLATWLAAACVFSLLVAAPSVADVQPFEVHEYAQDFRISQATAEERLETQQRGIGLAGELQAVLGAKSYAGVWFDNEIGEFVIPLPPGARKAAVAAVLAADGLETDYRTTTASSNWGHLEAAQERLDEALQEQIENRLVQTAIDPRTNAVILRKASEVGKSDEAKIRSQASEASAPLEVRRLPVNQFKTEPLACKTSAPRACGRPLRGGVSLTRNMTGFHQVGECSAGFKAIGNTNGNRFVLTAGHCAELFPKWGSEDANENFHPIGSVEGYTFPGGDWGKIKANGSTYWDWTPWPSQVAHYWEDQERAITSEAWSFLGQYVCHSGTQTGTSCGGVSALNVTADYGVNHLTEVAGVCVIGGDSGGPVFSGNTALGLVSGGDLGYPGCERPILYAEITEATSAMGVSVGTRLGGAPTATTNPASNVQPTQVTANGNINPNSVETHYHFEYGTTTSYGSSLPVPDGNAGHGTSTAGVSLALPNLKPDTTYHYRLVANSAAGTSYGGDVAFKTPTMPTPEPVIDINGVVHVFTRSADGQLSEWYQDGVTWKHKFWGYANKVAGAPSAVTTSDGSIWVYYRGTDNVLHRWWFNGPNWEERQYGSAIMAGNPSAITTGSGNIWVYHRGTDNVLHRWWLNGQNWEEHQYGSAVMAGDPSAVTTGSGNIWVYFRRTDNVLHRWWFNGPNWEERQYGYAELGGDPAAVANPTGNIDAFYVDQNWNLRHWWFKNQNWSEETIGSVN